MLKKLLNLTPAKASGLIKSSAAVLNLPAVAWLCGDEKLVAVEPLSANAAGNPCAKTAVVIIANMRANPINFFIKILLVLFGKVQPTAAKPFPFTDLLLLSKQKKT